jgi:phospholipase C
MRTLSRRKLLQGVGSAGALTAVTGCLPRSRRAESGERREGLDRFDYLVVLMMENRSFDNMLGFLYAPEVVPRGQRFEGVAGKPLSNPIPNDADHAERGAVPVAPGAVMDSPNPDPGEEYPHVNTQLYGTALPAGNRFRRARQMAPPFNAPPEPPPVAPMNGFVADYINNFRAAHHRAPTYDEYKVVMDCYPPEAVPVISALAREFAVCDHWHCAVPSQTFTNRAFFHAATSFGYVVNAPFVNWTARNRADTVFHRMDDRHLPWRVYFDPQDHTSATWLLHYPRLHGLRRTRFLPMERFYEDVAHGSLPRYSFIEPRLFFNHNDQHPPFTLLGRTPHSSVLAGELLIHEVYDAIRRSDSALGNNWRNTLLVITYDEHGGCYDHVPPPPAVPPGSVTPGQMRFRFDRLGVRVPAVLVSAFIDPRTVVNTLLDHNSVVKTMSDKWQLRPLTARDRASTSLAGVFNRTTPRPQETWPTPKPRPLPYGGRLSNLEARLNPLQTSMLGLMSAVAGGESAPLAGIETVGHALHFLEERMRIHSRSGD